MKYSHLSRSLKYSYLHQSLTEKRNISIWNDPWPNEKYSPLGRSLKYSYRHRSLTKRNISISVDRWPVDNSGLHFEIPCVEHAEVVDMRTCFMKVPPQEVQSVFDLCKDLQLVQDVQTVENVQLVRWYKMFKMHKCHHSKNSSSISHLKERTLNPLFPHSLHIFWLWCCFSPHSAHT